MKAFRNRLGSLLALSALGVAGCAPYGSNALPGASPSILDAVNAGCAEYSAVAAPLSTAPDAKVQSLLAYGSGLCDIATGKVKPVVVAAPASPVLDPSTSAWIGAITGALKAAAALSGGGPAMVVPLGVTKPA